MLFHSLHFALFLVVVLLVVDGLAAPRLRRSFLLVASLYFYASSSGRYVVLLLASTLLDFYCGRALHAERDPGRRRRWLALSLAGNLGVLAYFKYAGFAAASVAAALAALGLDVGTPALEIYLPIGISFFTFQSMSYTLDIHAGRLEPTTSVLDFALYVSFFPQLVAGPIVRARDFLPQLSVPRPLELDDLRRGTARILYGLVKKVCVADRLAPLTAATFTGAGETDGLVIALATVAFAVQIYCDFSGYSDVAIGAARALGYEFPENFTHPYFSADITEFWRRWHISLSTWLRDYLYIPLGGNRDGPTRQRRNLMITMLLGGLWHGAAWHFVIWGAYHGVLLAAHRSWTERGGARLPRPVAIACTLYLTLIGWLIFVVPDPARLWRYLQVLTGPAFTTAGRAALEPHMATVRLLLAFAVVHAASARHGGLNRWIEERGWPTWWAFAIGAGVAILLLAKGQESFLYFQF